jgi:hypothetical protein
LGGGGVAGWEGGWVGAEGVGGFFSCFLMISAVLFQQLNAFRCPLCYKLGKRCHMLQQHHSYVTSWNQFSKWFSLCERFFPTEKVSVQMSYVKLNFHERNIIFARFCIK